MDTPAHLADRLSALLLDVAATPLADLVSGDLAQAVCTDLAGALGVPGVAVLLLQDGRVVAAGCHGHRADEVVSRQVQQQSGAGVCAALEGRTLVQPDVLATPLRSGESVRGCLQVFLAPGRPATAELVAGAERAASVLGVVHANAELYRGALRSAADLSGVLVDRAPLEQAKGVLAERHRISVGQAFGLLRAHARGRRVTVTQVAREVVARNPGDDGLSPLLRVHSQLQAHTEGNKVIESPSGQHHSSAWDSRRSPQRSTRTTASGTQHPSPDAPPQDRPLPFLP